MKQRIILSILFFYCLPVFAQQTKQRVKVLQSDSSIAIPYANILIKNKAKAYVCDEQGNAMIDVSNGDTLIINSVGYFSAQLVYTNSIVVPVWRIYLLQKNIQLKEVTIKGINTKEDLKMAILRMRIEEKQKDLPGLKSYHGPMKRPPAGPMSPISMIYESEWAKKQRAKKWSKNLIMPSIK